MRIFNVFVRYKIEPDSTFGGYDSNGDCGDIEAEEYVGSFDSLAAADTAASRVDVAGYNAGNKRWKASAADAWTTFGFVFESELNHRVSGDAVSNAADKVASAARKEWRASPAGLAYVEKVKRMQAAYAARRAEEKEKREADAREARERTNAKARATRAAKKAAAAREAG